MKKRDKLTILFEEAERSRQAVNPKVQGIRCPICWREFLREAIINKQVTEEHIPQQSWGTICLEITCADCNRSFGGKYQGKASSLKECENLKIGVSKKRHRAKVIIDQHDFNALVYNNKNGKLYIMGSRKNNRPEVAKYWLEKKTDKILAKSMKILLKAPHDQKAVERVLLRDAYLLAFHYLGYPFLCTKWMQELRIILHEDKPIPRGAVWSLPPVPIINYGENGLFLWVEEPREIACILVQWNVPKIGIRYVVLPFFPFHWATYSELCSAWVKAKEGHDKVDVSIVALRFHPSARFSPKLRQSLESDETILFSAE